MNTSSINLKPNHKIIKDYYAALKQYEQLGQTNETAVSMAGMKLLEWCGRKLNWTLIPGYQKTVGQRKIYLDGALIDNKHRFEFGFWEAKDMKDDLPKEVKRKFEAGYPSDNILFQSPERGILWQDNKQVLDVDLNDPRQLIEIIQAFFAYQPQDYLEWERAIDRFQDHVPEFGRELARDIGSIRENKPEFARAFSEFFKQLKDINHQLSEGDVEEMLIQHILTERIFREVFSDTEFTNRNDIAIEIEKVIKVLLDAGGYYSRDALLGPLNLFYSEVIKIAGKKRDFDEKRDFLITVYERFFQGYSVKVADTHGIVYTPPQIVDFMVNSVEHILHTHFQRTISDEGVNIIDPFVGTGNFIIDIMRKIPKTQLVHKYTDELHCNELLLLPFYIARMNVEHEFFTLINRYMSFEGICLVDTFEIAPDPGYYNLPLHVTPENTKRVNDQANTPMFVIIGNPPYNVGQGNENDNNKNKAYREMDKRVSDTYSIDSPEAQLKNKLYDPYVKAIRWASDRIHGQGIVAFVTNNSFLDGIAFDGMRQHLTEDFDSIYIVDLGGNLSKSESPDSNVFGITVGVSINFFVKTTYHRSQPAKIHYHRINEEWDKNEILVFLSQCKHFGDLSWETILPDDRHRWFRDGLKSAFDDFCLMGSESAKKAALKGQQKGGAIFGLYSLGVVTSKDDLVYSFDMKSLQKQVQTLIEIYNSTVDTKKRKGLTAPGCGFHQYR